jgi:uncharacterized membrane protein
MGSLLAGSFLMLRYEFTGSMRYRFLVWNLFLAWIPYGCAVALEYGWSDRDGGEETRHKRRRFTGGTALVAVTWLLTFPNAPYILTDVVHLMNGRPFRWWFDAGLVLSFALTGCFLGVASLRIMHERVRERRGELIGWAFVLVVTILSGFGIYLGRFLRFNSWDVLLEPGPIFSALAVRIVDPLDHPQAYGVTLMFAALLFACYATFTSASAGTNKGDISR